MAAVVQLLILLSLGIFAVAAMLLVSDLALWLRHRANWRSIGTLAAFHAGALIAGWLAWRTLKPAGWTLSFSKTVQAGMDSETYGHVVEHAAEVLAAGVVVLAAAGGLLMAGLAWISRRRVPAGAGKPTAMS